MIARTQRNSSPFGARCRNPVSCTALFECCAPHCGSSTPHSKPALKAFALFECCARRCGSSTPHSKPALKLFDVRINSKRGHLRAGCSRGFIFTIDGLLSLLFAIALLSLVASFSSWNADYSRQFHYPQLARDYLQVRYGNGISSLTPAVFFGMTGINLTESSPSSGAWVRGEKRFFGSVANCANSSSCSFSNASGNAAFLAANDLGLASTRFAWVKP